LIILTTTLATQLVAAQQALSEEKTTRSAAMKALGKAK
jgi:chromosome segregation ATPase